MQRVLDQVVVAAEVLHRVELVEATRRSTPVLLLARQALERAASDLFLWSVQAGVPLHLPPDLSPALERRRPRPAGFPNRPAD